MNWDSKLFGVVPAWALVIAGITILLSTFGGAIFRRGGRRTPLGGILAIGTCIVVIVAMMMILRFVLGRYTGAFAPAITIFVLGIVFLFVGSPRIRDRLRIPVSAGIHPFPRLLIGNPLGPDERGYPPRIRISQLGMWVLLELLSLAYVPYQYLPEAWPWWLCFLVMLPSFGLVALFFSMQIRDVPGQPPHRGAYMFNGEVQHTVTPAGNIFLVPGIEDVFPVNVEKTEIDLIIRGVRTKDGAELIVRVQMPWVPDEGRLWMYLVAGRHRGVNNLADGFLEEQVRHFLSTVPEWSVREREVLDEDKLRQFQASGQTLEKPPTKREFYQVTPWQTAMELREGMRDQLIRMVAGNNVTREQLVEGHGWSDRRNWGIRVTDFNIGTMVLTGRMQDAADRAAEERAQRDAEHFQLYTRMQQVEILQAEAKRITGKDLLFDQAMRYIFDYKMAEDGHGFALPGIPEALREVLASILGQRPQGGR